MEITLSPLDTEQGQLAVMAIRDVTDRKLAVDVRPKSEERFRALLESSPDGMVVVDPSGAIQLRPRQANARRVQGNGRATARVRDLSDRTRLRAELEASFELVRRAGVERQELLGRLVRAEEAERLRISSDIHDDRTQAMAAAGL